MKKEIELLEKLMRAKIHVQKYQKALGLDQGEDADELIGYLEYAEENLDPKIYKAWARKYVTCEHIQKGRYI